MADDSDFRDFIVDQLASIPVAPRRMFGGVGLFFDSLMFGIIGRSDTLFFKSDETNTPDYEALGAEPFSYTRGGEVRSMGYHTVPAEIQASSAQESRRQTGKKETATKKEALSGARRFRRENRRGPR